MNAKAGLIALTLISLVAGSLFILGYLLLTTKGDPMKKNREHFISFDELAKKYLKPDVIQSFPDVDVEVDVEVEKANLEFAVKEIEFHLEINQMTATTFLVGLATLLVILLRG